MCSWLLLSCSVCSHMLLVWLYLFVFNEIISHPYKIHTTSEHAFRKTEWKLAKMNWTTILLYYCKEGSKGVLTSLHSTQRSRKTSILHKTSFFCYCSGGRLPCSGHPTACSCPYYLKEGCQQKDQGKWYQYVFLLKKEWQINHLY